MQERLPVESKGLTVDRLLLAVMFDCFIALKEPLRYRYLLTARRGISNHILLLASDGKSCSSLELSPL